MRPLKPRKSVYDLFLDGPRRWIKGRLYGYRGANSNIARTIRSKETHRANCFCLLGALNVVYPNPAKRRNAFRRLLRVIQRHTSTTEHSSVAVWHYNDADGTTYQNILDVTKEARV